MDKKGAFVYLVIAVAAYILAAVFLVRGFQSLDMISLLFAAVFTTVGKNYVRRYKEKR